MRYFLELVTYVFFEESSSLVPLKQTFVSGNYQFSFSYRNIHLIDESINSPLELLFERVRLV